MTAQRVQRQRTKGWRMPENTVYVGRGSRWGNPWRVDDDGYKVGPRFTVRSTNHGAMLGTFKTPSEAAKWAVVGFKNERLPALEQYLHTLKGKNLACWCPLDQPCHADLLLELANKAGQS